ncbi:MAG: hypothetical protein P1Q69_00480 [Candidatus Thorarchaeota archaeon]|nr:hypothetical protein [Candidatus Thorarchaeota archaeon]
MSVRIKDATIISIEDAETKKLKMLKITSKLENATLTLEIPDALCDPFNVKDLVAVTISSEPIPRGEKAKLYAEGTVFKVNEAENFEVVVTIGGLRMEFEMPSPKPTQRKAFDSEKIFLALN